jgi:hypothetical protein
MGGASGRRTFSRTIIASIKARSLCLSASLAFIRHRQSTSLSTSIRRKPAIRPRQTWTPRDSIVDIPGALLNPVAQGDA